MPRHPSGRRPRRALLLAPVCAARVLAQAPPSRPAARRPYLDAAVPRSVRLAVRAVPAPTPRGGRAEHRRPAPRPRPRGAPGAGVRRPALRPPRRTSASARRRALEQVRRAPVVPDPGRAGRAGRLRRAAHRAAAPARRRRGAAGLRPPRPAPTAQTPVRRPDRAVRRRPRPAPARLAGARPPPRSTRRPRPPRRTWSAAGTSPCAGARSAGWTTRCSTPRRSRRRSRPAPTWRRSPARAR